MKGVVFIGDRKLELRDTTQAPLRSPLHGCSHVLPSPCRSLEHHRSRTSKRMSRRYAFVCRRRIWPRPTKLTGAWLGNLHIVNTPAT